MSLADSFNAPLVETINGKSYKLPLFEMDDLAAVSRDILNEQKQQALARVAVQDTVARSETSAWFDLAEMDVEEMTRIVKTIPGARRFITRAFIVGQNEVSELADFFKGLIAERGYRGMVTIACAISRLWPTPRPRPEGEGPNVGSAPGGSTAGADKTPAEVTGDSTG